MMEKQGLKFNAKQRKFVKSLNQRLVEAQASIDAQPEGIRKQLEVYFSREVRNRQFE